MDPNSSEDSEEDPEEQVPLDQKELQNIPTTPVMADKDFSSLVGKIMKLNGGSNYWTCAKDTEMYLCQNSCWNIITSPLLAAELQTAD